MTELDSDILRVDEVAALLRCSKAHVYKLIAGQVAGVQALPAIRLGRRRLVRRPTLAGWKRANETMPDGGMLLSSQDIDPVDA